jgi:hypothetical protein
MPDWAFGSPEGDREYSEMCDRNRQDKKAFRAGTMEVHKDSDHDLTFFPIPVSSGAFTPMWPSEAVALLVRTRQGGINIYNRNSDSPPRCETLTGYAFVTVREQPDLEKQIAKESTEMVMTAAELLGEPKAREIVDEQILTMRQKGFTWPVTKDRIIEALQEEAAQLASARIRNALGRPSGGQ